MGKKLNRINSEKKSADSRTKMSNENNEKPSIETDIFKDPRFASLGKDPRFRGMSKSQQKLKIDKRFETMFVSCNFNEKSNVDKYGRKVTNSKADDLKKYYDIASSSDETETNDSVVSENGSDEDNKTSDAKKDRESTNVDSDEESSDGEKENETTEEDSDVEGN